MVTMKQVLLTVLSILSCTLSDEMSAENLRENSARVIIVGAGAAGIAAASRLLQNGFKNVTVLEAENRIGGRLHSVEMGEYLVDFGGQWVHGEKNNAAFELASPLGLLDIPPDNNDKNESYYKLFGSSPGFGVSVELSEQIMSFYENCSNSIPDDLSNLTTGSLGEYMENKFNEFFKDHPDISVDRQKSILRFLSLNDMAQQAADDWYHVSAKLLRDSVDCEGNQAINWKNQTYTMILDILMKKYPNPEQELPVENNTVLNTRVEKINYYSTDGLNTLTTSDGREYVADHIIFTGSLGVLKANYEKMFAPPLPQKKVNAIETIGMGHVAKIFLYYDEPWWTEDVIFLKGLIWTDEEWNEMEKNLEKRWLLSVFNVFPVEHKPKLLSIWLTGPYVSEMELVPEEVVYNEILDLITKFLGRDYYLTKPSMMKRTLWNTNDNFKGTYSYPTLECEKSDAYPEDLAEPIMKDNKPTLLFAGEATAQYYATVHGAISSGWREADRLIHYYSSKK